MDIDLDTNSNNKQFMILPYIKNITDVTKSKILESDARLELRYLNRLICFIKIY